MLVTASSSVGVQREDLVEAGQLNRSAGCRTVRHDREASRLAKSFLSRHQDLQAYRRHERHLGKVDDQRRQTFVDQTIDDFFQLRHSSQIHHAFHGEHGDLAAVLNGGGDRISRCQRPSFSGVRQLMADRGSLTRRRNFRDKYSADPPGEVQATLTSRLALFDKTLATGRRPDDRSVQRPRRHRPRYPDSRHVQRRPAATTGQASPAEPNRPARGVGPKDHRGASCSRR